MPEKTDYSDDVKHGTYPIPMTLIILSSLPIILVASLFAIFQPLLFGFISLIVISIFAILISFFYSSWYAYTFFLVFIGGLLVIFAYISALTPNSIFPSSFFKPRIVIILTIIIIIVITFSISSPPRNPELIMTQLTMFKTASDIYIKSNYSLLLIIVFLLLVVLALVVKICRVQQGPLRPFMYLLSINSTITFQVKRL